jgi:WD40 repeat protein
LVSEFGIRLALTFCVHSRVHYLKVHSVMGPSSSRCGSDNQASPPGFSGSGPGNAPSQTLRPPPRIADHEVLRRIGQGGFGEVWLARSLTGQYRAIKVLYQDGSAHDRCYDREFGGLRRFEPLSRAHDGFVDILQAGHNAAAGYFFYVMELADDAATGLSPNALRTGESSPPFDAAGYEPKSLKALCDRQGRLPVSDCIRLGLALTAALDYLHRHNLIHRDIKPANIIFVNSQPKLADVGLVTSTSEAHSVVGTQGYMLPGESGSVQADLYALGKVLYVASTAHRAEECPNPPTGVENQPDHKEWLELNEVVNRACHPNPKQRYDSAAEMQAELGLLQIGESLQRLRKREKRAKQAMLVLIVLAVAATVISFIQRTRVRAAQRSVLLLQLEQAIRPPQDDGWSGSAWEKAKEAAAKYGPDPSLQRQAAASLCGLDADRVSRPLRAGGSSVAFDSEGKRLLFGALKGDTGGPPTATLLDLTTGALTALSAPGSGPVVFLANGVLAQLSANASNQLKLWELRATNPGSPISRAIRDFDFAQPGELISVLASSMTAGAEVVAASATTASGGRCAVWDGSSGRLLHDFQFAATALALTHDGSLLAAGNVDGEVALWRVSDKTHVAAIRPSRHPIRSLAFGRDPVSEPRRQQDAPRWLIAVGDSACGVSVWEIPSGAQRVRCSGAVYDVLALAFNADSTLLATGGRGRVKVWDPASGRELLSLRAADRVSGLAFSPDRDHLAVSCADEPSNWPLGVWRLRDDRAVRILRGLSQPVPKGCFSADGRLVAAIAANWQVAIWDLSCGRLLHVLNVPRGLFTADNAGLAFNADASQFAFMAGTNAMLFNVASGSLEEAWQMPPGHVDELAFDSHGKLLAFHLESAHPRAAEFSKPTVAHVWELGSGGRRRCILELPEFNSTVRSATLATDGSFAVLGGIGEQGDVTNWMLRAVSLPGHAALWRRAWSANPGCDYGYVLDAAERIIAFRRDPALALEFRDLASDKMEQSYPLEVAAFNSLANVMCIRPAGAPLALRALEDARLQLALPATEQTTLCCFFSRDGKLLALGNADGTVSVYHLPEIRQRLGSIKLGW